MSKAGEVVEQLQQLPRSACLFAEVEKIQEAEGLEIKKLADYGDGFVIGYQASDGSRFVYYLDSTGKHDGVTIDDRDIPEEFYPFYREGMADFLVEGE